MDRNRQIAIAVGIALLAFLLGFVPQWMRANRTGDQLDQARFELRMSRTEDKIGAALTESLRSNYERARQLMTEVYGELQSAAPRLQGTQRREVDAILAGRDEMITLLARAAPESSQRLMLLYTRYHTAFAPQAPGAAATTPAK
jgi:histidinol-phosphate/aromatic aminotransferase/cobyric acid decarboxylase-like protein